LEDRIDGLELNKPTGITIEPINIRYGIINIEGKRTYPPLYQSL
jgi:hypothetical protein